MSYASPTMRQYRERDERDAERQRENLRNRICANAKRQADDDAAARGVRGWDDRAAAVHARVYWTDLATYGYVGTEYAAEHCARSLVHLGALDLGFLPPRDWRLYASQKHWAPQPRAAYAR